jgi:hypothetical protein
MNCRNVLQDPQLVDVKYVPTLDMFFESVENALAFYIRYARLACFDIRRNRKGTMVMHKMLSVKPVGNTREARD